MKKWTHYLIKNMPQELHDRLKSHTTENKVTMRQFILEAINEKLDSDK